MTESGEEACGRGQGPIDSPGELRGERILGKEQVHAWGTGTKVCEVLQEERIQWYKEIQNAGCVSGTQGGRRFSQGVQNPTPQECMKATGLAGGPGTWL